MKAGLAQLIAQEDHFLALSCPWGRSLISGNARRVYEIRTSFKTEEMRVDIGIAFTGEEQRGST